MEINSLLCFRMSAPYPVDPNKASAPGAGWNMPNAPGGYPAQPGYPTQHGYPNQPGYTNQPGYPTQPVYPVQPANPGQPGIAFPVEPPPPYSTAPGFGGVPGPYVSTDRTENFQNCKMVDGILVPLFL